MRQPVQTARKRGVLLIECLVYISVVTVLLGIGMAAFYKCWGTQRGIQRNADDIVRVLHVGEQWRADVRAATGVTRLVHEPDSERLYIPVAAGEVVYIFANGELWRSPGTVLLANVKSSRMLPDASERVNAWHWELELQPGKQKTRVRPLFSFAAAQPIVPR